MAHQNPETIYKERIASYNNGMRQLEKKDKLLSLLKVILFFAGIIFLVILFSKNPERAVAVFGVFFVLFVGAAVVHENVLGKIKHRRTLIRINETEIHMLAHRYSATIDNGAEFRDGDHNYTSDLDIFGEKSLFHYINRCVTSMGRIRLARWLKAAAGTDEVRRRQEAVNELANKINFRQNLRTSASAIDDTSEKLESLYKLFDEPFFIKDNKILVFLIHLLPLLTVGLFAMLFFKLPLAAPLGMVIIQLAVNARMLKRVNHIFSLTSKNAKILKTYSQIIKYIEEEPFQSAKMNQLKKELPVKDKPASQVIKRLSVLVELFDSRTSMIHFLVTNTLFWDLHCVYRIEKWRAETAGVIRKWFGVISDTEALSSFANLYYNNPGWTFPEIRGNGFHLNASAAGHPLIPPAERICNDLSLEPERSILMVTGPNMAGKSTFLRTVGVNTVLAMAGAPVCAARFDISPLKLVTSMQTSDSLDKHLSLFYAELTRLKMILDAI
ncbi:MAG: hypothetical protein GY950_23845, partial [bacterium]|nr:hypothetical protein [bacterium]